MANFAPKSFAPAGELSKAAATQLLAPAFTALELSIIRLARTDRMWTVREVGPFRRLWRGIIARGNPRLANDRLEALRKMAVVAWHFGARAPVTAIRKFLFAGFTRSHVEQLLATIEASRTAQGTNS